MWQPWEKGRSEVRDRLDKENKLGVPCSNLRSFGSKRPVLKEVLATLPGFFGAPIRNIRNLTLSIDRMLSHQAALW